MLDRKKVAIVIPVYNHGTRISDVVYQVLPLGFPVFVVDDGSTDTTPDILSALDTITVLTHSHNKGKGAALRTGFQCASGRVVIRFDGSLVLLGRLAIVARRPHRQQLAQLVASRRSGQEQHGLPRVIVGVDLGPAPGELGTIELVERVDVERAARVAQARRVGRVDEASPLVVGYMVIANSQGLAPVGLSRSQAYPPPADTVLPPTHQPSFNCNPMPAASSQ